MSLIRNNFSELSDNTIERLVLSGRHMPKQTISRIAAHRAKRTTNRHARFIQRSKLFLKVLIGRGRHCSQGAIRKPHRIERGITSERKGGA